MLKIDMQVDRVPTHDNIADLPSREEYALIKQLGGQFVHPVLDDLYKHPQAWKSLSLNK